VCSSYVCACAACLGLVCVCTCGFELYMYCICLCLCGFLGVFVLNVWCVLELSVSMFTCVWAEWMCVCLICMCVLCVFEHICALCIRVGTEEQSYQFVKVS
jgi:hypothetical protein